MLFAGGAAALLHMTGAVEDDPALAEADLAALAPQQGDVLLCLSASGSTPYTLIIARAAKAAGATIVGIANVAPSALLDLADIPVLLDTGPEVVAGSTRMGAGTAQKIALNMLSVLVGLQLGHVHEGYMVNVTADNAKLIDRAARIVAALSGADHATATTALHQTGGAVKPATLIAAGATPQAAAAALAAHDGHLGPALFDVTR
jgi:N-acetylmuramic acid 6-phosphate etherase